MNSRLLTIRDAFRSSKGEQWDIVYREIDSFDEIRHLPVQSAGAIALHEGQMILVYAKNRVSWEMPGGCLEKGETIEEGITREVMEESNMKIEKLWPLGYDTLTNRSKGTVIYQVRTAAIVVPYGPFIADPDGDITEIKMIDPQEYRRFFNWGRRSDVMIEKALRVIKEGR